MTRWERCAVAGLFTGLGMSIGFFLLHVWLIVKVAKWFGWL